MPPRPQGDTRELDIVIPYFGTRSFLEEAVMSVLAQSSDRWHLHVVEDGDQGTNTSAWLAGLNHPRITHSVNEHRLGVAGNFQRCLDSSRSPLVTLLGCDDRLLPHYVASMHTYMDHHPEAAAVFPGVRVIDEHGCAARPLADRIKAMIRPRAGLVAGPRLLQSLLIGNWTYFPATCWRREALLTQGFHEDFEIALDLLLLSNLVLAGHPFVVTDEVLMEYRRHSDSASSRALRDLTRMAEDRQVLHAVCNRARDRGWHGAVRAGRLRPTSRLHALTLLPHTRHLRPLGGVLRHAFGP